MKFVLIYSLLLSSFISAGQEPAEGVFPLKDGQIYYERIFSMDSVKKESIYKAVKSWGVGAFNSQKDVLQADDKEIGLIAYKYWFDESFDAPPLWGVKVIQTQWKYYATMKLFIKDQKIKIVVQDVDIKEAGNLSTPSILTFRADMDEIMKKAMYGKGYREKYYAETKINFQKANASILATIESLVAYLKSGKSEFDF